MTKIKPSNDHYPLTSAQVKTLTEVIQNGDLNTCDSDIGAFLLLLRAFTYGDDTARENMLCEVEAVIMPLTNCAGDAIDGLVQRSLQAAQKREGR
jgi:hypothetical protein